MPAHFTHLDKRGTVKLSTKIKVAKDRTGIKASRVAARLNNTLEAYWRGLSEQNAANAMRAYDDAVKLARMFCRDDINTATRRTTLAMRDTWTSIPIILLS